MSDPDIPYYLNNLSENAIQFQTGNSPNVKIKNVLVDDLIILFN